MGRQIKVVRARGEWAGVRLAQAHEPWAPGETACQRDIGPLDAHSPYDGEWAVVCRVDR